MTTISIAVREGSWLNRLDPRVKLWFAVLGVALCMVAGRLTVLTGALLTAVVILLLGGVPPARIARLALGLLPLVAIILIVQPLLTPPGGAEWWRIGPLRVTEAGVLAGARYALRLSAASFCVLVPLLSTPMDLLVRGLQKVGLPYTWGMTIGLALRYLGTLRELYTTILEAQQARGWDIAQGGLIKRARALLPTLVALIIASLHLGDSLALGMAARGFSARPERTWRKDITMTPLDWAVGTATTLGFASAVVVAVTILR